MTSNTEKYKEYIRGLLDLEDSRLRKELEMYKKKLDNKEWQLVRSLSLETLLKVYTGRSFKSITFSWLLLDNRVNTKYMIHACLKYILGLKPCERRYYTLVDWLRKFDKENAVMAEFPQTFSINLNTIWEFGLGNETALEGEFELSNETELEGKTTAKETQFCMDIDDSLETKGNELIDLEQLAISVSDANDDDEVGRLIDLFRKEFLNRGTSDLWEKCMKHLLQPIHIAGVEMMLKLNHDYDYIEQWKLAPTVLRMLYKDDGQIIGSCDEFINVVQLIHSYANARKPNDFEKELIAAENKKDFLDRFEIHEQITPGRPEDIRY